MRVWFNGRTSAFQADDAGSIPVTRSRQNNRSNLQNGLTCFLLSILCAMAMRKKCAIWACLAPAIGVCRPLAPPPPIPSLCPRRACPVALRRNGWALFPQARCGKRIGRFRLTRPPGVTRRAVGAFPVPPRHRLHLVCEWALRHGGSPPCPPPEVAPIPFGGNAEGRAIGALGRWGSPRPQGPGMPATPPPVASGEREILQTGRTRARAWPGLSDSPYPLRALRNSSSVTSSASRRHASTFSGGACSLPRRALPSLPMRKQFRCCSAAVVMVA